MDGLLAVGATILATGASGCLDRGVAVGRFVADEDANTLGVESFTFSTSLSFSSASIGQGWRLAGLGDPHPHRPAHGGPIGYNSLTFLLAIPNSTN